MFCNFFVFVLFIYFFPPPPISKTKFRSRKLLANKSGANLATTRLWYHAAKSKHRVIGQKMPESEPEINLGYSRRCDICKILAFHTWNLCALIFSFKRYGNSIASVFFFAELFVTKMCHNRHFFSSRQWNQRQTYHQRPSVRGQGTCVFARCHAEHANKAINQSTFTNMAQQGKGTFSYKSEENTIQNSCECFAAHSEVLTKWHRLPPPSRIFECCPKWSGIEQTAPFQFQIKQRVSDFASLVFPATFGLCWVRLYEK